MQQMIVPMNQQLRAFLIPALHHLHQPQKALHDRLRGLGPRNRDYRVVPAVPHAVVFVLELGEKEGVNGGTKTLGVGKREENEERDVAERQHAALHEFEE